jgi:hypothetical protein
MKRPALWVWCVWPALVGPLHAGDPVTRFDNTQVELRRTDERWQLWAGAQLVKDLGASEAEAREVIAIIRQLRLTQRGAIGTRAPIMEYWLAGDKAPQGLIPAYRLAPIDLATLRVEQLGNQWCLRDATHLWFNFGVHADDARQALATIKHYEFTRMGYVGQTDPVMIYFLGGKPDLKPTPALQPDVAFMPLQAFQVRQLTPPSLSAVDALTGEERLAFDWRRVELHRDGLRWRLMFGRECLADFGPDEVGAREALRTVQFYRFTEQCRVGAPAAPLVYYLVNGQAPHGIRFGARNTPFHPERLAVRQVDSQWMLCDGVRPILHAGANEDEAKRTLQAIQKYKFDNICAIGANDQTGLRFLVKDR